MDRQVVWEYLNSNTPDCVTVYAAFPTEHIVIYKGNRNGQTDFEKDHQHQTSLIKQRSYQLIYDIAVPGDSFWSHEVTKMKTLHEAKKHAAENYHTSANWRSLSNLRHSFFFWKTKSYFQKNFECFWFHKSRFFRHFYLSLLALPAGSFS